MGGIHLIIFFTVLFLVSNWAISHSLKASALVRAVTNLIQYCPTVNGRSHNRPVIWKHVDEAFKLWRVLWGGTSTILELWFSLIPILNIYHLLYFVPPVLPYCTTTVRRSFNGAVLWDGFNNFCKKLLVQFNSCLKEYKIFKLLHKYVRK